MTTRQLVDFSRLRKVDGGITVRTAALAVAAGANEAVAGTAVFGAKDLRRAIRWGPSDVLIVSVRICREKTMDL